MTAPKKADLILEAQRHGIRVPKSWSAARIAAEIESVAAEFQPTSPEAGAAASADRGPGPDDAVTHVLIEGAQHAEPDEETTA